MNASWDNPTDDDREPDGAGDLDRLVDGELTEAQRRELLLALERQPDGWRRCALAFLEAQEWKRSLGALRAAAAPAQAATPPRRALPLGRFGTLAAMAATFVAAVGLVLAVQGWRSRGAGRPGGETVARVQPQTPRNESLPPGGPALAGQVPPANGAPGPWQRVRLSLPDGPQGPGADIELPACEREQIDEAWLSSLPATMPPEVLQALQRAGYEVQRQQRLLPLPMEDGRRLVVPVERVNVRYVGRPSY